MLQLTQPHSDGERTLDRLSAHYTPPPKQPQSLSSLWMMEFQHPNAIPKKVYYCEGCCWSCAASLKDQKDCVLSHFQFPISLFLVLSYSPFRSLNLFISPLIPSLCIVKYWIAFCFCVSLTGPQRTSYSLAVFSSSKVFLLRLHQTNEKRAASANQLKPFEKRRTGFYIETARCR